MQPPPVQITKLGPVNQHLHGPPAAEQSPTPEAAAPVKRTRGPDKQPRGPRKTTKRSKRISKGNTQRREAAAASSRLDRPRSASGKRAVRRTAQSDDELPNVMTRPQRKRKPPVSADASPVAASNGTHPMASRKRARPATAAALEDLNNAAVAAAEAEAAQARKPRAMKKTVKAAAEHAVAQAVPSLLLGQQAQTGQLQATSPHQLPTNAVAVAVDPNTLRAAAAPSVPLAANQVAQQVQPASPQAQLSPRGSAGNQPGNPSSLLLLAQQQMQQRLNQQAQLPSSSQQSAPDPSQDLRPLGNATAQQALLAQLISQQAAHGLTGHALDASMHPFFSQGLAGALLRQGMPAQQSEASQEQPQQLSSQLLHTTAAQLTQDTAGLQVPQAGVLYPGQVISPGTILPMTFQGQVAGTQLAVQPSAPLTSDVEVPSASQAPEIGSVAQAGNTGSQAQQASTGDPARPAAVIEDAAATITDQVCCDALSLDIMLV